MRFKQLLSRHYINHATKIPHPNLFYGEPVISFLIKESILESELSSVAPEADSVLYHFLLQDKIKEGGIQMAKNEERTIKIPSLMDEKADSQSESREVETGKGSILDR